MCTMHHGLDKLLDSSKMTDFPGLLRWDWNVVNSKVESSEEESEFSKTNMSKDVKIYLISYIEDISYIIYEAKRSTHAIGFNWTSVFNHYSTKKMLKPLNLK